MNCLPQITTLREDCKRPKWRFNLSELVRQKWLIKERQWNSKIEISKRKKKPQKSVAGKCTLAPGDQAQERHLYPFQLSVKYIGIAIKVLNAIPRCSARKTRELCPFTASGKKRWTHRADMVDHHVVMDFSSMMVVLYPGDAIESTGKYFTLSFGNEGEFTEKIVGGEARKDVWNDVFPTGIEQGSCIYAVSSERNA